VHGVDHIAVIVIECIGNVTHADERLPAFHHPRKLNALLYTLHAVVRPNGVYVIKQQHLKYLAAGCHERHGHKVVHLKAQVVVLFGKRLDERFARADNLCICRADPQHVRVAGRQKRLNLIIVIPRYNVGGKLQQSLCSHSAPRKKRLICRKTSCIY
jgi:hypothetical protein